jgi:Cu/Zn superoxide dismutase
MTRVPLVVAWTLAVAAIVVSGASLASAQEGEREGERDGERAFARAKATLNSCTDGTVVGSATLIEAPSAEGIKNVTIHLSVRNLPPGKHGVHIHEVGWCTPCSAAGSHLDLGPFGNNVPVTANHPYHSGDLINVRVRARGNGFMAHVTSRVAISDGNLSIFDENGASLVIHAMPDTYCANPADPNCAGGGRIACGVLQRVE